jgi:hypothetical protein
MQSCIPTMIWWWCGGSATSYPDEVLGSTPQTWLNGLALSHVSCLTLSGAPKILLYCTEYRRPTTLSRITSTVLLCRWGRQSLEEMTSLGTDFEMHAIGQGYVEDPAAKDFVVRKAHTIALSNVRGLQQSTLYMSMEIPWGFLTRAVLRSLARLISHKKVSVRGF